MSKVSQATQAEAVERLKSLVMDSDSKLFMHVDSVSKSGMSRKVLVYALAPIKSDGVKHSVTMLNIGSVVAKACGLTLKEEYHNYIQIRGCGFNVLHAIAQDIEQAIGWKVEYQAI